MNQHSSKQMYGSSAGAVLMFLMQPVRAEVMEKTKTSGSAIRPFTTSSPFKRFMTRPAYPAILALSAAARRP